MDSITIFHVDSMWTFSMDYTWIPLQFSIWIPCGNFPWITHGFHDKFPCGFHMESTWNPWDLEDICQYFPWNIHVESIWIHGISIMEFPWITVGIHIDSTMCAVWDALRFERNESKRIFFHKSIYFTVSN